MASTGVNVLRWSALAGGVFYGFSHQRTITATQKADHIKHEYEKKQSLINQAKAEYAKTHKPAVTAAADDGAFCGITSMPASLPTAMPTRDLTTTQHMLTDTIVVTDVNSPSFDLEKFLTKVAKENP
ncbi:hypothetical protein NLG97_g7832 [Lecanicillium saksenae]|uniref:Uncharacterized protein n=1 Tax=Lecanicillium saksenae TaxID=468837 RepID=A0ACC1QKR8_9HYPO|nr:hypothetical protein NLG97_g7832 [Lecanicillium saksenae]